MGESIELILRILAFDQEIISGFKEIIYYDIIVVLGITRYIAQHVLETEKEKATKRKIFIKYDNFNSFTKKLSYK